MATEQEIRDLKRRYSMQLLKEPGVSGVGVEKDDSGQYVLAIHVEAGQNQTRIPSQIEGCPVKRIESGPFRKLAAG